MANDLSYLEKSVNGNTPLATAELLLNALTEELPTVASMDLNQLSGFLETLEKNPDLIPKYIQCAQQFMQTHKNYRSVIEATIIYLDKYKKDLNSQSPEKG
jgi:hypothetical protein